MTWVLGGLVAWFVLALAVAVVLGRSIRLADRRSAETGELPAVALAGSPRAATVRVRRRTVPVPPVGIALIAVAVALETAGFALRVTGASGTTAQLLSMDAPLSLPRMFVAALFAAAALAALAGAGTIPGRRTWWMAVGLVAVGIAAVKAGSTVHHNALTAVTGAVGATTALLLSAAVATLVVGALWFLSRDEQRDRRRVLSVLALYAGASVGLSELSALAAPRFSAAATYLEETGEALAGVAFLLAVLVGVAPRLVLPAAWPLRRVVDAHTLEVQDGLPARRPVEGSAHL